MATVGHIAVGMAAARLTQSPRSRQWPFVCFWIALSMLPDADVASRWFGIAFSAPLGHRGATHSIVFAVVMGAIVTLAAGRLGMSAIRAGVLSATVVLSHPLLDMLTNGARGCAIFWPFDAERYLSGWRPLTASPIGLGLLSPRGMWVMATETVVFAPLILLALPRRSGYFWSVLRRPAVIAVSAVAWLASVWLINAWA